MDTQNHNWVWMKMFINRVNINTNDLCEMIIRHEQLLYTGNINDSDLNVEMENGGGNNQFDIDSSH